METTKKIKYKKIVAVILSFALCGIGIVGGTYALFQNNTNAVSNDFKVGQVNIAIMEKDIEHEDFKTNKEEYNKLLNANDSEIKVVTIKNKGMDSYVRVMLEANIVSDTNESEILLGAADVKYTFAGNTSWRVDREGTYYYTKVLKKGETSEVLLQEVTTLKDIPQGYHLEVKVLTDAISAKPNNNLKDAWGVVDFSNMKDVN